MNQRKAKETLRKNLYNGTHIGIMINDILVFQIFLAYKSFIL